MHDQVKSHLFLRQLPMSPFPKVRVVLTVCDITRLAQLLNKCLCCWHNGILMRVGVPQQMRRRYYRRGTWSGKRPKGKNKRGGQPWSVGMQPGLPTHGLCGWMEGGDSPPASSLFAGIRIPQGLLGLIGVCAHFLRAELGGTAYTPWHICAKARAAVGLSVQAARATAGHM